MSSTRPSFSWSVSGGAVPDRETLTLWESGDGPSGSRTPLWSPSAPSGFSANFDFDSTAVHDPLLAGRQYLWVVTAQKDQTGSDSRVHVTQAMQATQRFALPEDRPTMPQIDGKMIYTTNPGNQTVIRSSQYYSPVAEQPSWFGPVGAVYADFSPDGKKVIYSEEPQRYLWVDSQDGSPPTCLGITGFDARWSPDGTQICFSRYRADNPTIFNIWVANADGTNERMLCPEYDYYQRFCMWSADGQWIAYRRSPDDAGVGLWLVHPDGSDNHPLVFTGVEGYPGYTVDYTPEHGWSPDGGRLATYFDAVGPGPEIRGLGVVSRDGGVLKPIFISPPGLVCSADVHIPYLVSGRHASAVFGRPASPSRSELGHSAVGFRRRTVGN